MATQAAAAYAVKQQVNSGPPQVGSPNGGDEQQEAKPAGWREWILRVGAVGNCKFPRALALTYSFSSDIFALCFIFVLSRALALALSLLISLLFVSSGSTRRQCGITDS